jgi:hypothetical protein
MNTSTLISVALAAAAGMAPAFGEPAPNASSGPVAVVVTIPIPAGTSRDKVLAGMQISIPQYQAIPGLARKYYTLSEDGKFGGIYLWRNRADAQAWFSDAWRAKSTATYGVAPEVRYFDVPIVIDGSANVASTTK